MKLGTILAALLVGLVALGEPAVAARGSVIPATPGLLGYKWQPDPVHMTVYAYTTNPIYTQALADSVAMWNASPYVEMTIATTDACKGFKRGSISACETSECHYNYAALQTNGDRITSAVIFLNDGCNDFTLDYTVFLRSVCQEVGHSLGLDHNADTQSCMGGGTGYVATDGDLALLALLYGG